jgi:hypothetical protein
LDYALGSIDIELLIYLLGFCFCEESISILFGVQIRFGVLEFRFGVLEFEFYILDFIEFGFYIL